MENKELKISSKRGGTANKKWVEENVKKSLDHLQEAPVVKVGNGYSFAAGAYAAGGSFFGKLPSLLVLYMDFVSAQILCITLMIVCNVQNWRFFIKALQRSGQQTMTVTVLTATTNYIITFIAGVVIFKEPMTIMSIIGSTLIICGLWFLCKSQK